MGDCKRDLASDAHNSRMEFAALSAKRGKSVVSPGDVRMVGRAGDLRSIQQGRFKAVGSLPVFQNNRREGAGSTDLIF